MPKLAIFVTHPVQYHVPLWRELAKIPRLDVRVFYFNDQSIRGGRDRDFGVDVKWDVDLLGGYEHQFLSRDASLDVPQRMRIVHPLALLRRERPDWVWISGYTHRFEQQLAILAPAVGARIVMRAEFSDQSEAPRSRWKSAVRNAYLRMFYSRVAAFCFPGVNAQSHLRAHGAQDAQMYFSPYSVDDSLITEARNKVDRRSARAALGIADDIFVFLFSGKLIPRKDPMALLNAIRAMPDHRRIGLVALGDGQLRDEFASAGRELLGDRFVFPGFVNQSELGRYFRASDALVMPSRYETWGLVVNEAMHYGMPVIASDQTGCHRDLIVPGKTGYTFVTGDDCALAEKLVLLSSDAEAARAMGAAAELRIKDYTVKCSARGVLRALSLDPLATG